LYKLVKETAETNPRLKEPLLLYAIFSGKTEVLLQAARESKLYNEYRDLLALFNEKNIENALSGGDSRLPEGFRKVYKSYLSVRDRLASENHTKALMRNRIVKLQIENRVSNYRIYTDLRLNSGNVNAYLKHGDISKVSLTTARRALEYLEGK
jgi:hypothetical protein